MSLIPWKSGKCGGNPLWGCAKLRETACLGKGGANLHALHPNTPVHISVVTCVPRAPLDLGLLLIFRSQCYALFPG